MVVKNISICTTSKLIFGLCSLWVYFSVDNTGKFKLLLNNNLIIIMQTILLISSCHIKMAIVRDTYQKPPTIDSHSLHRYSTVLHLVL